MWYLIWIIQSIFSSISMILSKKVLENKKIWNDLQTFFIRLNYFLFIVIILYFGAFGISINIPENFFNIWNVWFFIFSTMILYVTYPLRRIAYANEKISVLQPFAMLSQIFPIVIGFIFLASERTSLATFFIALLTSFLVVWFSVDFGKIKINRYSMMVLTSSLIKSVQVFAVLYFLKILSPIWFFFFETIIVMFIATFLLFFNKQRWEIKLLTKDYVKLFLFSNSVAFIALMLNFTLYVEIWIVATSLLNMLYLVFVYVLSYLVFGDKPCRKDLFLSFLIVFAILLSSYLKFKGF